MSNIRTPLFDWHIRHKARIVPFGGWDMPVQYTSVIEEHKAVRTRAGMFDISHMARFTLRGEHSQKLLEQMFTNAVSTMKLGQVRYGLVCNELGGILDDVLVTRFEDHFNICVNAGNREKIWAWLQKHALEQNVEMSDQTFQTTMIALQGPKAVELVNGLCGDDLRGLKYYYAMNTSYRGQPCVASRTGYTGEDGYEFIVPNTLGETLWQELTDKGVPPCGLGARDTLRLEAAMPLYGHELSERINPLQAGLGWAVKLEKGDFIGKDAIQSTTVTTTRVGLMLEGKRAAREGSSIINQKGVAIGSVTSGSYVPWLERSIAMGYLPYGYTSPGTQVIIDLRGTQIPAEVVTLPFYKRSY